VTVQLKTRGGTLFCGGENRAESESPKSVGEGRKKRKGKLEQPKGAKKTKRRARDREKNATIFAQAPGGDEREKKRRQPLYPLHGAGSEERTWRARNLSVKAITGRKITKKKETSVFNEGRVQRVVKGVSGKKIPNHLIYKGGGGEEKSGEA